MVNLGDQRDVDRLIKQIKAAVPGSIRAIVLDPLIRAMPGKSDSETADMNVVANNCEKVAHVFEAAVIVGQHAPRVDETRSRGSNVLDGSADAMWSVVKADGISTVTIYRMKDGPEGLTWKFRLERFELGVDRRGKAQDTCCLRYLNLPTFGDEAQASAGS